MPKVYVTTRIPTPCPCKANRFKFGWVTFANGSRHLESRCMPCDSHLGWVNQAAYGSLAPDTDDMVTEVRLSVEDGATHPHLVAEVVATHPSGDRPWSKRTLKRVRKALKAQNKTLSTP